MCSNVSCQQQLTGPLDCTLISQLGKCLIFFFHYTAAVRSGILKCYRLFILIFPSVCRLLEQEKMSHNDLKQTWEMANVQFVENLKVQSEAFTRVWNVLTPDQRAAVQLKQGQQQEGQQEPNRQPQVGHLIDLQSPQTSPQPTNDQVNTLDKKSIHVQSQKYSWAKKIFIWTSIIRF